MAKLKSFEEYIIDGDSAKEIENDMVAMAEPKAAGDGEDVQADAIGAEEVEGETEGEGAGEEVEDMDGPETEGEQDMKIGDDVVDTEPQDKSDEIEAELEDPTPNEVEEGNAFGTARLKAIEAGEDEFEFDGKTYPVKDVDADDKEAAEDMVDEEVSEEAEEEVEEAEEEVEETAAVSEMMKEMYEACKNEAKVWEDDMHDEHTVETYMCENAALAAALAVQSLKEMKEDMTLEMYEAACESLKESYSKKIDEMKEAYASEGEEVEVED